MKGRATYISSNSNIMAPIAIADNTRLEQSSTTVDPGIAQIDPQATSGQARADDRSCRPAD